MDDEQAQGWLLFAVIVLVTAGIMGILDAIWAWRCGGVLIANSSINAATM